MGEYIKIGLGLYTGYFIGKLGIAMLTGAANGIIRYYIKDKYNNDLIKLKGEKPNLFYYVKRMELFDELKAQS